MSGLVDRTPGDAKLDGVYLNNKKDTECEIIHVNNPTAVAVLALCAATPCSGPVLDSFLEAGGIAVVVQVLRESPCPATVGHAALLVRRLMAKNMVPGYADRTTEVAEKFLQGGVCSSPSSL
jgi:hypothetical protein